MEEGRGDRLNVSRQELTKGSLYLSHEAKRKGLIDRIGSSSAALEKAAELAGLDEYRVVDVNRQVDGVSMRRAYGFAPENHSTGSWTDREPTDIRGMNPGMDFFYMYLPSRGPNLDDRVPASEGKPAASLPELGGQPPEKVVLVDTAHGNAFEIGQLSALRSRLASRGFQLRAYRGEDLDNELEEVDSFLVLNPETGFTWSEINAVGSFVDNGGRLLMANDPGVTGSAGVNALAVSFNFSFAPGYLYDQMDNYGIYRNIYLEEYDGWLYGNGKAVLPTATYVESGVFGIGFTANTTVHSATVRQGSYPAIARRENVMCIGDWSFAAYPWVNLENNSALLTETAEFLAEER